MKARVGIRTPVCRTLESLVFLLYPAASYLRYGASLLCLRHASVYTPCYTYGYSDLRSWRPSPGVGSYKVPSKWLIEQTHK